MNYRRTTYQDNHWFQSCCKMWSRLAR